MEVIVDDTQLSLAIGKKGQNVRLAAKLLGWRIDIKSEEEKRQEVGRRWKLGVRGRAGFGSDGSWSDGRDGGHTCKGRHRHGGEARQHDAGRLLEALEGIDEATVERIQQAVNSYYGQEYAEEVPAPETEAGAETAVLAEEAEAETSATMSESVEAGADPGAVGETASQPESKETSAL